MRWEGKGRGGQHRQGPQLPGPGLHSCTGAPQSLLWGLRTGRDGTGHQVMPTKRFSGQSQSQSQCSGQTWHPGLAGGPHLHPQYLVLPKPLTLNPQQPSNPLYLAPPTLAPVQLQQPRQRLWAVEQTGRGAAQACGRGPLLKPGGCQEPHGATGLGAPLLLLQGCARTFFVILRSHGPNPHHGLGALLREGILARWGSLPAAALICDSGAWPLPEDAQDEHVVGRLSGQSWTPTLKRQGGSVLWAQLVLGSGQQHLVPSAGSSCSSQAWPRDHPVLHRVCHPNPAVGHGCRIVTLDVL